MHKIAAAPPPTAAPGGGLETPLAAPKYGTLIPNRIFVGGISGDTTEADLTRVFSAYGTVKSTKIIVDRAGVSKGYGFVTFETEQEAQRLQADGECVVLRDRKLNIAPAIKKQPNPLQSIVATNGAVYYTTTPPAPISNIPMDQFAAAVYPPVTDFTAAGVPAIYPPSAMQYQPFYQYYSVPMNVPTIWPQNYQENHSPLLHPPSPNHQTHAQTHPQSSCWTVEDLRDTMPRV
ncbi:protein boule isoform X1 [Drosophila eugracilis]|uniref:protein boule isoform X1 n=1 Tax=Drosophila eugracilis TaxID=29029 RepID=UPI0007E6F236|nr:protein boule isoform X1 [Drosophila eugracilis]XP_017071737.1 protein boule isoform X1 [Drosophila eugracilis]XP_017071739.1 protein boule isoform X1 [Drosophila eugracilis]XP_017071740.1 protein boule isoform X1 [Drosophila eugracilis]XP_017071741.1 protein boule isoform X1 [Drosophila eugracilis]XP_017071742.1 protein boule isoform X1 [Drosophila eugracilis]XP_041673611.1 protein boule isoform X1 [Drosophila eugracilis]